MGDRSKRRNTRASTFSHQSDDSWDEYVFVQELDGIKFSDPAHLEKYQRLKTRKILATQYFDLTTSNNLGLKDFPYMMENVGWTTFYLQRDHIYAMLVLEFLSTMEWEHHSDDHGNKTWGTLNVQMRSRKFTLSSDDINDIFGFPNLGGENAPNDFNPQDFWHLITHHKDRFTDKSKASSIRNPHLRYAQRLMGHTIFGRYNNGGITIKELAYLFAMIHPRTNRFNSGVLLIRHLLEQTKPNRTAPIINGGLITAFARHSRIPLTQFQSLESARVDIDSLVNGHHLLRQPPPVIWSCVRFSQELPHDLNTVKTLEGVKFQFVESDDEDIIDVDAAGEGEGGGNGADDMTGERENVRVRDQGRRRRRRGGQGASASNVATSSSQPQYATHEDVEHLREDMLGLSRQVTAYTDEVGFYRQQFYGFEQNFNAFAQRHDDDMRWIRQQFEGMHFPPHPPPEQ